MCYLLFLIRHLSVFFKQRFVILKTSEQKEFNKSLIFYSLYLIEVSLVIFCYIKMNTKIWLKQNNINATKTDPCGAWMIILVFNNSLGPKLPSY